MIDSHRESLNNDERIARIRNAEYLPFIYVFFFSPYVYVYFGSQFSMLHFQAVLSKNVNSISPLYEIKRKETESKTESSITEY